MKTDIEAEKEYEVDKSEVKERGGVFLVPGSLSFCNY